MKHGQRKKRPFAPWCLEQPSPSKLTPDHSALWNLASTCLSKTREVQVQKSGIDQSCSGVSLSRSVPYQSGWIRQAHIAQLPLFLCVYPSYPIHSDASGQASVSPRGSWPVTSRNCRTRGETQFICCPRPSPDIPDDSPDIPAPDIPADQIDHWSAPIAADHPRDKEATGDNNHVRDTTPELSPSAPGQQTPKSPRPRRDWRPPKTLWARNGKVGWTSESVKQSTLFTSRTGGMESSPLTA